MFETRKRGRIAAALAVAAGLLLTTATTASAETIDPQQQASLTITKLADPGGVLEQGDGREVKQLPSAGLEGVNFRIRKVEGIDLTTKAGWESASAMTVEQAIQALDWYSTTVDVTGPTDSDGRAVFNSDPNGVWPGLPFGLYLVEEVAPFPADIIPTTAPFLVTVPMTDPVALDHWMYDVFVYPKNADTSTTKTVNDTEGYFLGDYVEFDVTMTVPRGAEKIEFTDVLDPRLELGQLSDDNFSWITGYIYPEPLTGPELMTKPWSEGIGSADLQPRQAADGSEILTVTFDDPEFLAQHEGQTVGFRIRAKVVGVPGEDGVTMTLNEGEITNVAKYFVNTAGGEATGESNPVVTKWGTIRVHKVNKADEPLEGAEFCLAKTKGEALAGECVLESGTLATDGSGNVVFYVRVSDFENNDKIEELRSYWLFETKAPEGYELMAEPIEVQVLDQPGTALVTVTNYPHNAGFDLPVIGGNRAVLPIVAAVIAAGGVVWLIRSRREQKA